MSKNLDCPKELKYEWGFIDSSGTYNNFGLKIRLPLPKDYYVRRSIRDLPDRVGGSYDSLNENLKIDRTLNIEKSSGGGGAHRTGDVLFSLVRKIKNAEGVEKSDQNFEITVLLKKSISGNEMSDMGKYLEKHIKKLKEFHTGTIVEKKDSLVINNQKLIAKILYYRPLDDGPVNEYFRLYAIKNINCINVLVIIRCKTAHDLQQARDIFTSLSIN